MSTRQVQSERLALTQFGGQPSLLVEQAHDGEQDLAQLARFMSFGLGTPGVHEPFGHWIGGRGILAVRSQNVTFGDAS